MWDRNRRNYGEIIRHVKKEEFKELKNRNEAVAWGKLYYGAWAVTYLNVMSKANKIIKDKGLVTIPVEAYCGYVYRDMNAHLRFEDHRCIDTKVGEYCDILTMVLCSAPRIPENIIVYRLVSMEFIQDLINRNKTDGSMTYEKGFMSTGLLKSIANTGEAYTSHKSMLKIYVPKGAIGIYVNVVTSRGEEEILLAPGYFLGLIEYPYFDEATRKMIYECQLFSFDLDLI